MRSKSYLIVDGYNVIRCGSRYKNIELPDYTDDYFNVARERLMNDVIDYAGRSTEAIIVYDAADRIGDHSEKQTIGPVTIMFSQQGVPADHVIEKIAHDIRERGYEGVVVTSDASIQDTVFGGGIVRMSAEGFCRELAAMDHSKAQERTERINRKSTIADRIPNDVLEKLYRMRDGED